MDIETLVRTRQSLHAVGELVMAGPQYLVSGTIKLRVVEGGFATWAQPELSVDGDELIAGEKRIKLDGQSYAAIAEAAGVREHDLSAVYPAGSGLTPADVAVVDAAAARLIADYQSVGNEALQVFAPTETSVLWPEHFDNGISLDAVNYGVSSGDGYQPEPYAYVGPHEPRTGEFWNAPFGAVATVRELGGVDAMVAFFSRGRDLASQTP